MLKPTFTRQHIGGLDKQGRLYRAYDGTTYLPGIVGLNNIKANDYANAVLQVHTQIALHFLLPQSHPCMPCMSCKTHEY